VKRLPILPTLIVAAAVAVMIGLGVWQLQRAAWKERMLTELEAARNLPPVNLDPLLEDVWVPPVAFRRALVTCEPRNQRPLLRAGRNRQGVTGYSYFIRCRSDQTGFAARLEINAGWSQAPNSNLLLLPKQSLSGQIGTIENDNAIILTSDIPLGPLQPSAPPEAEDIPNNHLMYAFQWFFFAVTAAVIYALALRRRRRSVAPGPAGS
jgi:surfeit locus 1 family protein